VEKLGIINMVFLRFLVAPIFVKPEIQQHASKIVRIFLKKSLSEANAAPKGWRVVGFILGEWMGKT
jgi:hypothetical protein